MSVIVFIHVGEKSMTEMQETHLPQELDSAEPRELTLDDVLVIAGGPQIINDWPG
jgi:hypothetical protein